MSLDWPAFGSALWKVSDATGIRPEWQLPVISLETGGTFDPAITNPGGCVGLNQFCPGTYGHYVHVPVSDYRTWPASQQLAGPVLAYWQDALHYGPIRSSTRLMLAQLGQALLASAPRLDSVVFSAPSAAYQGNAGFDTARKGSITVQDIANAMTARAATGGVQQALARAYAMRPGEVPRDPVYGDDYPHGTTPPARPRVAATAFKSFAVGAALGLAGVLGYAAYQEATR